MLLEGGHQKHLGACSAVRRSRRRPLADLANLSLRFNRNAPLRQLLFKTGLNKLELAMRKTILKCFTLIGAAGVIVSASLPALAYDYPYCLQGRTVGIPGECSYRTYAQCMDSASGRGLYCNINPRAAFNQQRQPRRQRY